MTFEIIFLFALALVWIVFAVVQDLRSREIANWLNFSLIVFALGFRLFYSLFSGSAQGFMFFYHGLIGFSLFFVIGNLMYHARFFAGGDAKLMIALGAVLPFTNSLVYNLKIFGVFFAVFLISGAIYTIGATLYLSIKNFKKFKKEFSSQIKKRKKIIYVVFSLGILLMTLGFIERASFLFGVFVFLIPYIYFYTKAVDESCMIKKIKTEKLREGDWLSKDVKIRGKVISANWDGLTKEDIRKLRKNHKEVLIRYGIPFTPVFLISFLVLGYLFKEGMIEVLLGLF